jgi:hypothetical protein
MAYNKDSGESRLRRDVNPETYTRKKNKSIFKNSQTQQQSPPTSSQYKTNYDWEISGVDVNYEKKAPQSFFEYERQRKEKSGETKQESLSFMDIIGIIVANGIVPVVGGFVYYIVFSSKGEKQKAMQSIVLSAIVSTIRIMYLVNSK